MKVFIAGGAKGIGYGLAQRMIESKKLKSLIITSRSQKQIDDAITSLVQIDDKISIKGMILDYLNDQGSLQSIESLDEVFDVVFLNSGIAFNGKSFNKIQFDQTMQTNYFMTIKIAQTFLKHGKIIQNGKIIITSSSIGKLNRIKNNDEVLKDLSNYQNLNFEKFSFILDQYTKEVFDLNLSKKWPNSVYAMSKLFLSIHTYFLQKQNPNFQIVCFCPGWCSTELTKFNPNCPKTAYEGAETGANLALLPIQKENLGLFFHEGKQENLQLICIVIIQK